jgi:hypothetical protein
MTPLTEPGTLPSREQCEAAAAERFAAAQCRQRDLYVRGGVRAVAEAAYRGPGGLSVDEIARRFQGLLDEDATARAAARGAA